jgi:hypothetical protein
VPTGADSFRRVPRVLAPRSPPCPSFATRPTPQRHTEVEPSSPLPSALSHSLSLASLLAPRPSAMDASRARCRCCATAAAPLHHHSLLHPGSSLAAPPSSPCRPLPYHRVELRHRTRDLPQAAAVRQPQAAAGRAKATAGHGQAWLAFPAAPDSFSPGIGSSPAPSSSQQGAGKHHRRSSSRCSCLSPWTGHYGPPRAERSSPTRARQLPGAPPPLPRRRHGPQRPEPRVRPSSALISDQGLRPKIRLEGRA